MTDFKPGDRVHYRNSPHDIGIVSSVHEQATYVEWEKDGLTRHNIKFLRHAPAPFRKGDRVYGLGSPALTFGTVTDVSRVSIRVHWDGTIHPRGLWCDAADLAHAGQTGPFDDSESIGNGDNRSTEPAPAPFKVGDRVENVNNQPGFIMTVIADQYTSGAVLVEWPNKSRHTEQAEHLKLAASETTIHDATMRAIHKTWDAQHKYRDDDPKNPTPDSSPRYADTIIGDVSKAPLPTGPHIHFETWNGPTVTAPISDDGTFEVTLPAKPADDAVNHPTHYTSDKSGVECIQITRHRNFAIGSAIKYLWRAGLKQGHALSGLDKEIEDLQKSIFYIQDEIARLSGGQ